MNFQLLSASVFLAITVVAGCGPSNSSVTDHSTVTSDNSQAGSASVVDAGGEQTVEPDARPNFLIILADDLGFSDLGAFGSEIETPHLDSLARDGIQFTNFYAAGTCSPTRSMLLTGVDHHRAGLGNMIEHIAPNQRGMPGYEGYLNNRVVTIAQILSDAGYHTSIAGKWHLGMTEELSPPARGFQRSFVLLNGGASHFDQAGLNAQTHPAPYREDGAPVDLPADFSYSTDFYTNRIIGYIEEARGQGKPFFAYLAYTAPHWPLQAPPELIEKYKGVYDGGWEVVQKARLERMKASGLVPESAAAHPIQSNHAAWGEMSPEARMTEARKMEIYAAMVDRLDQKTGELIHYLKDTGQFDNTVIVFMSDNGAEGAPLNKMPAFQHWMNRFDNSLGNLGLPGSYVYYEERWAQVSMTPFRLYKGMSSDGGIHVPAFVHYGDANIDPARYDGVVSVLDIAPTFLDLAGVEPPSGSYGGRNIYPMQGVSLAKILDDPNAVVRTEEEGLGWELFNKKGYRQGRWKLTQLHEPFGPNDWQLFDVSIDPGETTDLAREYPEVVSELVGAWERFAERNGVILGNTPPER